MKYAEVSSRFRRFFELPASPVAVKINSDKPHDELDPRRYCEMVRLSASHGDTFTFTVDDLSCASAELALGFEEPKYGEVYPRIKPADTTSVTLAPLEKADFEPDVVIVIGNPRKIMRMATTLGKIHGREVSSKFKGEFAVCGECTAIPVMENTVNLSLLCAGARMFGGYEKDEIAVGFPMQEFEVLAEGLTRDEITAALCGCLMDDLPSKVIDTILGLGFVKGTDHFTGRFGNEIVRFYTPKDTKGKITSVTLHVPVKFKDAEAAMSALDVAAEVFEDPMLFGQRDNWIDVALPVDLGESINRAVMRGEKFNSLVKKGIEVMLTHIGRFKRKSGLL
ncbi:MAG: DUF169 domain-containing protein [Methanosarcinales archaeon]|nr:DUF169 domain-containing protein [ANME-2 cluster archaeon]MDW7774915.1 DUF169 domain-containing protein [Methanosarcinales archaeon]